MFATSTLSVVGVSLFGVAGVAGIFFLLRSLWGGGSRSGRLKIWRWIEVAEDLSQSPRAWKSYEEHWAALDLSTSAEVQLVVTPEGTEDKITVTLDGIKLVATFRLGALMHIWFEGQLFDDTTREYRNTQAKLLRILNALRDIAGEEAVEPPEEEVQDDAPNRRTALQRDEDRLKLALKKQKLGGGKVPKAIKKLGERKPRED